jgi:hypothetical protein
VTLHDMLALVNDCLHLQTSGIDECPGSTCCQFYVSGWESERIKNLFGRLGFGSDVFYINKCKLFEIVLI